MHILHNKHHTSNNYTDFIPLLSPPTATSIYHIPPLPPFLSYVYTAITSSHRWFHALYIVRHLGSPKRLREHQFFHGIRAILSSRNFFFFFSTQPTQFFLFMASSSGAPIFILPNVIHMVQVKLAVSNCSFGQNK